MTGNIWDDRRKALEESFFMERNRQLLEQLRANLKQESRKEALRAACGISDAQLLQHLVDARIDADTFAALALVPLVTVAWADGKVQGKEREAILSAVQAEGMEAESPCYQMFELWLESEPGPELVVAWKAFVTHVAGTFSPEAIAAFRQQTLGRAEKVARAAGGILGVHAISASEREVLDDLASAF